MSCPNCGAPGGGPSGCVSCGLGRDPNVGGAFNAGQDRLREQEQLLNKGEKGCFPGDTKVLTLTGYRNISELKKGDYVLSLDSSGKVKLANIKRFDAHKPHRLVEIVSDTKDLSFRATRLHPVQTARGWVAIQNLKIGDELYYATQFGERKKHKVKNIVFTHHYQNVYNIVVDGDHTYILNGCIAHSFVSFRALRCFISKLIATVIGTLKLNPISP